MEEPLLGRPSSRPKIPLALDPRLFNIPEGSPVVSKTLPIRIEDGSLKERLVYGSLESPTSSLHFLFDPRSPDGDDDDGNYDAAFFSPAAQRSVKRTSSNGRSPREFKSAFKEVRDKDFSETRSKEENEDIDQKLGESNRGDSQKSLVLPLVCSQDDEEAAYRPVKKFEAAHHPVKKFLRKSMTAPALSVAFETKDKCQKPQLKKVSSIVFQASIGLVIYMFVGVLIYIWNRKDFSGSTTHPIVDALYFCVVTLCTIGYGDIAPLSATAKLFACAFVLVGFGFIDILLSGMVAFVLERQETLLLSAVEGSHHETAMNYLVNTKKGRMRIRMKVALAMLVVIGCLGVGTAVMHRLEQLSWLDSFYLACMSVTTVGYGDHTFQSMEGRLFAAIWLLVSTLAVARAFLFFAEARIDRRNRLIAKWVLHRQMTVGDLVAADIDNNGYIT
ncbi:hypothetical protein O6H91_16G032500 [Diphasiastrum complanatum]|nr:hypothetical protein O6H91_16G032500 [Diphasiastrum complanatum]